MPGKRNKRRVFLEQLGKALVTPFIQRRARLPRTEASAALVKAVQRATYRDQPRRDHAPAAPDHAAPAQAPNPAQPSKRKSISLCNLFLSGTVQVAGSAEPIVALVGDDVILPCTLRPTNSAVYQTVEWQRPDLKPKEVHLYRDEKDDLVLQNPSFRGRTSLFKEELVEGNASLKLTRVELYDAGNYTCYVALLDHQKTTIQLIVGAASRPVISIEGIKGDEVVLRCEAEGCYPEPVMEWCDVHGRVLPAAGPPETSRDREGCYTVTSHVNVPKTDNNTFTCRVQQPEIKHMKERRVHIPDQMFPKQCQS
ncbi:CD276 antigen-like, partial [Coregonus clupeaformis]|uniref:CD276 antigen-like n=1 Tax=Coregonus clupeaformis TaxID=59861 RepID=UPI001E1C4332